MSDAPAAAEDRAGRTSHRTAVAVALTALMAIALGLGIGWLGTASSRTAPAAEGSAEAGFVRDMQQHHAQAVELATLIQPRTDDERLRLLAYDIMLTQQGEIGRMYGWLEAWGLPPASPEPAMTWMSTPLPDGSHGGHGDEGQDGGGQEAGGHGDTMPGMASFSDVQQLGSLAGPEADRLFLTLMLAHHRGGVEMAEALLARSDDPIVAGFAGTVIRVQSNEIGVMESMLAELG